MATELVAVDPSRILARWGYYSRDWLRRDRFDPRFGSNHNGTRPPHSTDEVHALAADFVDAFVDRLVEGLLEQVERRAEQLAAERGGERAAVDTRAAAVRLGISQRGHRSITSCTSDGQKLDDNARVTEQEAGRPDEPLGEDELESRRREAAADAAPHHRIYLGMAPGVGKTVAALHELHRLEASGVDVVVGYVETYNRAGTVEALRDLITVPRRKIAYKGVLLEEMDLEEILLRHPEVVMVDELAHANVPGSKHAKRWQDVQEILGESISVISTLNIQHLESLADIVAAITGVEVHERVPDEVVDRADEIELVDLSPRALRQRIERGEVYPHERASEALRRYFREGNLAALRELALRKVSTQVERDLEAFMRGHAVHAVWPAGERVMVGLTDQHSAQHLLRRGWRMANRNNTDLLAVFVETPDWASAPADRHQNLEDNLRFAEDLGAKVERVQAASVAEGLLKVAHDENVAHIVIGHAHRGRLQELLGNSVAHNLLRLTSDVDIHVVAVREHA